MARVQQQTNNQKQKQNQTKSKNSKDAKQAPKSKLELAKTQGKREPSKNEILLFRAGMTIIGLTLLTLAIIFTIRYYMNKDEDLNPFEDYFHITVSELEIFATYIEDTNTYGDLSAFDGKPEYSDLRAKIQGQDVIYFFFYRSSDIKDDMLEAIKNIEDIDEKPILFINMDDTIANNTLFSSEILLHLNLNDTRNNMFLIYDIYAEDQFELYTNNNFILLELAKL